MSDTKLVGAITGVIICIVGASVCFTLTILLIWHQVSQPAKAQAPPPPIVWDAATDTLTITRMDVMVCIPQAHDGKPSCRFAKWWTETVIK